MRWKLCFTTSKTSSTRTLTCRSSNEGLFLPTSQRPKSRHGRASIERVRASISQVSSSTRGFPLLMVGIMTVMLVVLISLIQCATSLVVRLRTSAENRIREPCKKQRQAGIPIITQALPSAKATQKTCTTRQK